ncbi:MAG: molybdopterin oxidoreductase family protein, partial [Planctomycetaceae bacterium]
EHRTKVANILNIDEQTIPREASWSYDRIMSGIDAGEIKGLWIICTNPAHSWIDQNKARETLKKLDYLVVQDIYHSTETTQLADLVLPAAGWSEKDGTFINSERRIGVTKKVRRAPGQALSDFNIFRLIADGWGCGDMFKQWDSPASVFELLKSCTSGMPCDITAIQDYAELDRRGGIQWPYANPNQENERHLFADGEFYHPDGRAKFITEEPCPLTEPPSDEYPLILLTGRGTASQWHTQTRTSKSAILRKLYPDENYAELSPKDARPLHIKSGDRINVVSRRGSISVTAFVTPTVGAGQIFIPMHYEGTNKLTDAVFDPYSKQPSYKACAVRIATEI